jgi:two-component sensor histidine kinase
VLGASDFVRWLADDPHLAASRQPVQAIVARIASIVRARSVFVGVPADSSKTMRTVAWWKNGRAQAEVEYPMGSSPGDAVNGPFARSVYPLTKAGGTRIGHIGVVTRAGRTDLVQLQHLMEACAGRVAGEVERLHREEAEYRRDDLARAQARSREKQLLESISAGETLLRELHHRVKNNLQIVASLLTMQADGTNDESVARALSDAKARISTIALIHSQLCEGPKSAFLDMNAFVRELALNVQHTFSTTTRVVLALSLDELKLPLRLATPCGLLISELVTNAYQHAFGHARSGLIQIRLSVHNRSVTLVVRDNGRGMPLRKTRDRARGLGLRLIRLLATKQLRGRLTVSRRNGTAFTVTFPRDTHHQPVDRGPKANRANGGRSV